MSPLFRFIGPSVPPIPITNTDDDGSLRSADGKLIFDLADAAAKSGLSMAVLEQIWTQTMRDFFGPDWVAPGAPTDTSSDAGATASTANQVSVPNTAGVLVYKPLDDNRPWESLTDDERAAAIARRRHGLHHPADIEAFRQQAIAGGWDPDNGECYPRKILNEETGEVQVVAVAKIEALQRRVCGSDTFGGMEGPFFCGPDGVMSPGPWLAAEPPTGCRIVMHRKGVPVPYEVSGSRAEFVEFAEATDRPGNENPFWKFKGATMLEKCVESKGYRKGWRDIIGSVYIPEELPRGNTRGRRRPRADAYSPDAYRIDDAPAHQATTVARRDAAADPSGPRLVRDDDDDASDDALPTESTCRRAMARVGIGSPAAQDRLLAEARRTSPLLEDDNPERFFGDVVAKAQRMAGQRRSRA